MDKKLYLLAELDNDTQAKIKEFEEIISKNGLIGKQTKEIPYHITLCSFPVEDENRLIHLLEKKGEELSEINITFSGLGLFGLDVLFLNPYMNKELINIYLSLNKNSDNENDDLAAHVTLLIDEPENIIKILPKIAKKFQRITGKLKYLSLYEFFPARIIRRIELKRALPSK